MARVSEGYIHRSIRRYLVENSWTLVAGQWPGGSDDDLHVLYITNPVVAKDQSPEPRRHSLDKFVPDLVALKNKSLLIIEAKPRYSKEDFDKLHRLFTTRFTDLQLALKTFALERDFPALRDPDSLQILPALAFHVGGSFPKAFPPWVFLLVNSEGKVYTEGDLP